MAEKKRKGKDEEPRTTNELSEAEARGEGDLVILTNDSGEVKKLSPDEWEESKAMLYEKGWRVLGEKD